MELRVELMGGRVMIDEICHGKFHKQHPEKRESEREKKKGESFAFETKP